MSPVSTRDVYSQLVSFEGSMVKQVKPSVVLLGEVNVGHHDQDLNDGTKILSNGIMERCVPVGILMMKEEKNFEAQTRTVYHDWLFDETYLFLKSYISKTNTYNTCVI